MRDDASGLRRRAPGWLWPGLMLLLSGCGSAPDRTTLNIAAPLPAYGAGDSYTFDDDRTDRVVDAGGDEVHWRSSDGASFVTGRDVMLPPMLWQSGNVREERRFVAPTSLFPLRTGNGAMFLATVTGTGASGQTAARSEQWRCAVGETAKVPTDAGQFDTFQVTCDSFDLSSGRRESHRYFYAPEIGFYVRREDTIDGKPPHVAVLAGHTNGSPPLTDSALRLRVEGIQRSLEHDSRHEITMWRDPATGSGGQIEPLRTVQANKGRSCREFLESIETYGRHYKLRGTGCRDESGGWQVTSIEPDATASR